MAVPTPPRRSDVAVGDVAVGDVAVGGRATAAASDTSLQTSSGDECSLRYQEATATKPEGSRFREPYFGFCCLSSGYNDFNGWRERLIRLHNRGT